MNLKKWFFLLGSLLVVCSLFSLTFMLHISGIVDLTDNLDIEKIDKAIDFVSSIRLVVGER